VSRDSLLKDENGIIYSLESLSTQKWLEGHYSGLDQCCQWLDQRATLLFNERKRDDAIRLQNLVDEMKRDLRPKMVKRAEEHEREFPSQVEGGADD
jgi:hypothetical protein